MRPLYLWAILPILVFLSSSSTSLLLGQCEGDILVIINEIGNGEGANSGEYVELLVIGDSNNPGSPVDLSNWIVDDNNASVLYRGNEPGHIRLGACFSSVEPGTLILIYDDEREVAGVLETQDGAPNANGVYQIPFNSDCILKIEGCPSHSSQNYCTESVIDPSEPVFTNYASYWNEFIPMRNAGDALQLLSPDGILVHSLYWGDLNQDTPPNNYPFKTSDRSIAIHGTAVKKSYYLSSSTWNNPSSYGNQPGNASPGLANSPENQVFINSISEGNPFGEELTIDCSVKNHVMGAELGMIGIGITGGILAYNVEIVNHTSEQSILVDNEGVVEIGELEAGDYQITVKDARGCEQSCELTIEDLCEDEYTICPGESVQIGCLTSDVYCYKWEPEEGLDNPTIPQPTASPEQTTTYTLYVIDDNGNIVETHEATVFISEPVKISPEVLLFCEEDEENELSYSPDFSQVVWSTGETSEIIEVNEAGVYSITATDVNGCESTDEIKVYDNDNITNEQIAQLLEDAGFIKIPVEILDEPPGFSGSSGAATNCTSDSPYLENLVGEVLIAEGSSSYCLSDAVVGDLELGISEGLDIGGVIMDNFCSGEYTLEDFLAYGNGEFDAVIQVYVMNLEGEDFLFVNTNNYQPFIESETVEGIVYPPNLDVIDDLSTEDVLIE